MLPHFLLSVYLVYNYIKQAMFQKFFKIFFEKINTIARLKFFVYVLRPLGLFTWTSFRMNVTLSLFNFFAFLYLYLQICFLWGKIDFCIFLNNCFKWIHNDNRTSKSFESCIFLNKTPMGHIAHLSNNSHNKISFMKLYTKHLSNVVE